jgi:hypothetical protein
MAGRAASCWIVIAMIALAEAVYLPPALFDGGRTLLGSDYQRLHVQRIAFARQAILAGHGLPAWCPYDFLGAPFTANLQSFPWIPTRLLLLLLDPEVAYAAGVALAAALAAGFTFLFCRRAGLSPLGAAAAGWTFACAGFFSSRVAAGHLPLLEAYAALPLLLWAADRALASPRRRDLLLLALSAAGFAVAGHPQVPAYALAATALYALWRGRGAARARVLSVLASGAGATLIVWWPMLLLIQRSSRILPLAPADNDIAMPYRRLLALLVPGIDGWPGMLPAAGTKLFDGYPNYAYFWDTASYLGLVPLAAVLFLALRCLIVPRRPARPWMFLAALGLGALVCSLPLTQPARALLPGMLLRSPARLLYLSTFAASAALGAAVDAVLSAARLGPLLRWGIVGACLALHAFDLGGFARHFILAVPRPAASAPELDRFLARELGDARLALDPDLDLPLTGRYEDVGGFDSILLAGYYRAMLPLMDAPAALNVQAIDASSLPLRALQATGARFVVTSQPRDDLPAAGELDGAHVYRVPGAAPRAEFLPPPGAVRYSRPSSDEIAVQTDSPHDGHVRLIEAYDPGWTATVDGRPASVADSGGIALAVPVPAGCHAIRLRYHTPGRTTGVLLSLLSTGLLAILICTARPRSGSTRPGPPASDS